jgi:hypothetical protein
LLVNFKGTNLKGTILTLRAQLAGQPDFSWLGMPLPCACCNNHDGSDSDSVDDQADVGPRLSWLTVLILKLAPVAVIQRDLS